MIGNTKDKEVTYVQIPHFLALSLVPNDAPAQHQRYSHPQSKLQTRPRQPQHHREKPQTHNSHPHPTPKPPYDVCVAELEMAESEYTVNKDVRASQLKSLTI